MLVQYKIDFCKYIMICIIKYNMMQITVNFDIITQAQIEQTR